MIWGWNYFLWLVLWLGMYILFRKARSQGIHVITYVLKSFTVNYINPRELLHSLIGILSHHIYFGKLSNHRKCGKDRNDKEIESFQVFLPLTFNSPKSCVLHQLVYFCTLRNQNSRPLTSPSSSQKDTMPLLPPHPRH